MQIVQELCKRPGLNRTGFDMPTIYIPNPNKTVRCVNQIDDVCRDIEKTINQTIQVGPSLIAPVSKKRHSYSTFLSLQFYTFECA